MIYASRGQMIRAQALDALLSLERMRQQLLKLQHQQRQRQRRDKFMPSPHSKEGRRLMESARQATIAGK